MWIKNNGQTEDEIIQNRFTSYLTTAIQRRRRDYIQQIKRSQAVHDVLGIVLEDRMLDSDMMVSGNFPAMMVIENQMLMEALIRLDERERYILLSRILEEKSFEKLAQELGLTYKGASAIYYRAIKKVKKYIGGGNS